MSKKNMSFYWKRRRNFKQFTLTDLFINTYNNRASKNVALRLVDHNLDFVVVLTGLHHVKTSTSSLLVRRMFYSLNIALIVL